MGTKVAFVAHGFADDYFTPWWRPVRTKFEGWGYEIVEVSFDGLARTIDSPRKYAELVEVRVEEMYDALEEEYEGAEIVVVGHSMGGMVARYFVERLGYDDVVDRIVTFGSPHQGTWMALPLSLPVIGTGGARDLMPGSQFLEMLNRDGLSEDVDYAAVYTLNDPLILPKENAALPELNDGDVNIRVGRSLIEVGAETLDCNGDGDAAVVSGRRGFRREDLLTGHLTMFYNDDTWEGVAEFLGVDDVGESVSGDLMRDVRDDARWAAEGAVDRVRDAVASVVD
ncbi:MAG: alpha/beta fold hydrolase [Halobacteriota archaeon]